MLVVLATPCDMICSQVLMLHKQGGLKATRNILIFTCCRDLCHNTSPKRLRDRSLSRGSASKLFSSALLIHSSPRRSFFCYHRPTNYNKSAILPFNSCGCSSEYQSPSVQHRPPISFPQQPGARPSHSGYNNNNNNNNTNTLPCRRNDINTSR